MKKIKSIFILPTNRADNCLLKSKEGKLTFNDTQYFTQSYLNEVEKESYNLHITSDEDIKLGDLHFNSKYNEIRRAGQRDVDSQFSWRDEDYVIEKLLASTSREFSLQESVDKGNGDTILFEPTIKEIPKYIVQAFADYYSINRPFSEVEVEYKWDQSCVDAPGGHIYSPKVNKNGELIVNLVESSGLWKYSDKDLLEIMNLGMELRQNQLSGHDTRSGNEVLENWIKEKSK